MSIPLKNMKLHANAALSVTQRSEVKRLHQDEGVSIRQLAKRYHVNPSTIARWVKRDTPYDRVHPSRRPRVVTPAYRQAVIAYRQAHPTHGANRIAQALQAEFPQAHRGSISRILHQEKLSQARPPKPEASLQSP